MAKDPSTNQPETDQNTHSEANNRLNKQELLEFYKKTLMMSGQSVDHLLKNVFEEFDGVNPASIDLTNIEQLLEQLELEFDLLPSEPGQKLTKEEILRKIKEKKRRKEQDASLSRRNHSLKYTKKTARPTKTDNKANKKTIQRRKQLAKIIQQQLILRDPNTIKDLLKTLKNHNLADFYKQLSPSQKAQVLKSFATQPRDVFIQQANIDSNTLQQQKQQQQQQQDQPAQQNNAINEHTIGNSTYDPTYTSTSRIVAAHMGGYTGNLILRSENATNTEEIKIEQIHDDVEMLLEQEMTDFNESQSLERPISYQTALAATAVAATTLRM